MKLEDFKDKQIECRDCGVTFTFSAGEQAFFWSKGMPDPKRCLDCRKRRKANLIIGEEVKRDGEG